MTVDDSNVIDKLVELGLNTREAKLYFALLRAPESTVTEVAQISGVQRNKIYELLEQMKAKGFCGERQEGHKKFYRATRPDDVFTLLSDRWETERHIWESQRKKWEAQYKHRQAIAQELFTGLGKLFDASASLDPALERLEIIRSKEQINLRFLNLMTSCQVEILSFTRPPYAAVTPETRVAQLEANQAVLDRGVRVRTLYMVDDTPEQAWLRDHIREVQKNGEESRIIDDLPIKMFVFDRRTVLISLQYIPGLSGADFTMLVAEDHGLVQACTTLFETYWARGRDISDTTHG